MCFTTVERQNTQNFDGSLQTKPFAIGAEDEAGDPADDVELPTGTGKDAVLPNVLRNLVQKRKLVKD